MKTRLHFLALALASLSIIHFAFSIVSAPQARAASSKSKPITAEQLEQQLKAAKKPKSDKWKLSLLPVGLQKNPQVDYTIITEMTDAGRKLPEPSFTKPVYYVPHSVGQKDVGDAYGGTKEVKFEFLKKQLDNALASNGYRPYAEGTPQPTQVLFFSWGMHNRIVPLEEPEQTDENSTDTGDGSGDTSVDASALDTGGALTAVSADSNDIINLLGRAKTIGGNKFANEFATALADQLAWSGNTDYESNGPLRTFAERDPDTEALVYAIFNDCYFLIVYSMDAEALARKERKLLWTTRISTTSQGVSFEQTLPIMISNAAWYFGRPTDTPEIIRRKAYRDGRVDIGDLQVVGFETGSTAATGTAAPAAKPATKSATKPSTTTSGTNKK